MDMKSHVLLCKNHYLYVCKSKYKYQNKVPQKLTYEKLTLRFTHFSFSYKIRNINLMHFVLFYFVDHKLGHLFLVSAQPT